jgi:hypothetical protein
MIRPSTASPPEVGRDLKSDLIVALMNWLMNDNNQKADCQPLGCHPDAGGPTFGAKASGMMLREITTVNGLRMVRNVMDTPFGAQ